MAFIRYTRMAGVLMAVGVAVVLSGCEDHHFHHDPPPGQGSLIVDNTTWDVIHVYINGYYVDDVGDYEDEAFDRNPGEYRVVLDQKSGSRSYSHDVDILEGKLTVLEVRLDDQNWEYDVRIYYE